MNEMSRDSGTHVEEVQGRGCARLGVAYLNIKVGRIRCWYELRLQAVSPQSPHAALPASINTSTRRPRFQGQVTKTSLAANSNRSYTRNIDRVRG